MREAGFPEDAAGKAIKDAYEYYDGHGAIKK